MIKKYRKKPVVIEAVQWTGSNMREIAEFAGEAAHITTNYKLPAQVRHKLEIATLEGDHRANIGDYIIKGVAGEFYPCKPEIFEQTYEEVGE